MSTELIQEIIDNPDINNNNATSSQDIAVTSNETPPDIDKLFKQLIANGLPNLSSWDVDVYIVDIQSKIDLYKVKSTWWEWGRHDMITTLSLINASLRLKNWKAWMIKAEQALLEQAENAPENFTWQDLRWVSIVEVPYNSEMWNTRTSQWSTPYNIENMHNWLAVMSWLNEWYNWSTNEAVEDMANFFTCDIINLWAFDKDKEMVVKKVLFILSRDSSNNWNYWPIHKFYLPLKNPTPNDITINLYQNWTSASNYTWTWISAMIPDGPNWEVTSHTWQNVAQYTSNSNNVNRNGNLTVPAWRTAIVMYYSWWYYEDKSSYYLSLITHKLLQVDKIFEAWFIWDSKVLQNISYNKKWYRLADAWFEAIWNHDPNTTE